MFSLFAQTITKPTVYTQCGYNVTTSATYDAQADRTTFTWTVVNRNPGNGSNGTFQDLSHWSQKLSQCVDPGHILSEGWSYGTDGSLGQTPCISGEVLKFNSGTSGSTPSIYTLVLEGHYYPVLVLAAFKAGNSACCDYIWGIGCCTLALSATKDDVDCYGGNNGSINLTITGGTSPFTILWTTLDGSIPAGEEDEEDPEGLTAGTYEVTVTDNNGCEEKKTVTIEQPDAAVSLTVNTTNVSCNGGSDGRIYGTVSGGTAPYVVTLIKGSTTIGTANVATDGGSYSFPNLSAGTDYTLTAVDAAGSTDGCADTEYPDIIQPNALNLTATGHDPDCSSTTSGSITGTVSGGTPPYKLSINDFANWVTVNNSGGSYTIPGLSAGDYTVKVRDANYTPTGSTGCTDSEPVTLTAPVCNLYGCTPGFWKNHTELWDHTSDAVVAAMPTGYKFTTSTNFFTYFSVSASVLGSGVNSSLTMEEASNLGGGDCKTLARHGVSALLNAAAFGTGYPDGYATFTDLYYAIKAALTTGNCLALATALNTANNTGCPLGNSAVTATELNVPSESVTDLKIAVYPNPYNSTVNFQFASPVAGRASLELYDVVGRRLAIVFEGQLEAGMQRSVNYTVPAAHRVPMIYKLTIGSQSSFGRLLPGKRE